MKSISLSKSFIEKLRLPIEVTSRASERRKEIVIKLDFSYAMELAVLGCQRESKARVVQVHSTEKFCFQFVQYRASTRMLLLIYMKLFKVIKSFYLQFIDLFKNIEQWIYSSVMIAFLRELLTRSLSLSLLLLV